MDQILAFKKEVEENIKNIREDSEFQAITRDWMAKSMIDRYSYNFSWLGRPIIQYPQDIVAMQEIVWEVKPDLIIETGIAHGGSLIFYASMMHMMENNGKVLGIDIDIRKHNREEIEKHPMYKYIDMFEGSSIDVALVEKVHNYAKHYKKVLVVLDSCHTTEHVYEECKAYSDLVVEGSYLVVLDTVTEWGYQYVEEKFGTQLDDRPWGKDNGPMKGMNMFLAENDRFKYDDRFDKLGITVAPCGYLKCVK